MSTIAERIEADYKTAMKAREQHRVDVLRLIKAAAQRVAIEKRKDGLDDREVIQVLSQQAKQIRETIESAKQGSREDILTAASEELAIIQAYLPEPLSEEALKQIIEEAVQAVGPNRGQVMKHVMAKASGAADGKLVSQLVGARLSHGSGAA